MRVGATYYTLYSSHKLKLRHLGPSAPLSVKEYYLPFVRELTVPGPNIWVDVKSIVITRPSYRSVEVSTRPGESLWGSDRRVSTHWGLDRYLSTPFPWKISSWASLLKKSNKRKNDNWRKFIKLRKVIIYKRGLINSFITKINFLSFESFHNSCCTFSWYLLRSFVIPPPLTHPTPSWPVSNYQQPRPTTLEKTN